MAARRHPERYDYQTTSGDSPIIFQRRLLSVAGTGGSERHGSVILAHSWDPALAELAAEEDFSLVILHQPPDVSIALEEAILVWAPAYAIKPSRRVADNAAFYTVDNRPLLALPPAHIEALSKGRLFSSVPIWDIPPRFIEDASNDINLNELIAGLMAALEFEPFAAAAQFALGAPAAPQALSPSELKTRLARIIEMAEPNLQGHESPEMESALTKLRSVTLAIESGETSAKVGQFYDTPTAFAEHIYALRALAEEPQQCLEAARMRQYVAQATVPATETELTLDRTLAWELLGYATIVTASRNRASAAAAFDLFQKHYRFAYQSYHGVYWKTSAVLQQRLLDLKPQAEALRKLNALRELGLPVGLTAIEEYEQMLAETLPCPRRESPLPDAMDSACPECGLSFALGAPEERVTEIIHRIESSLSRQLTRLTSATVRQVLARSGNPRVEQFLKVVQAAQLSSLPNILDEALLRYLRRFLLESRINEILDPLLNDIQEGDPVSPEQAEKTLRAVSRLLERSGREGNRRLPPPAEEAAL